MFDIFLMDTSLLVSFFVLLLMSFLSLVISLVFLLKLRVIRKLPKNLTVNVFNKTFNVFDPYTSRRKIIHSLVVLFPFFAIFGAFILTFFLMTKVFEMALILGLTILIICLNLMMIDEAFEAYKNANTFIRAVKNKTGLGKGDLTVLFLVKETLPKLSVYYLLLAVIFVTSSVTLPYVMPAVMLTITQLIGVMIEFTVSVGLHAVFFAPLSIIITTLIVQIVAKKFKSKIFGFPSSESSNILGEIFERMKTFVLWTGHHEGIALRPFPEPEEALKSEQKKSNVS